ncbi:MAG: TlpA family protein disulfide reductase [Prevotella sp.]|nr:TlpA family protein disulfide reductase [Prevotella sp.]
MILSNKQTITTALLVLVCMIGQAQTKTATVTGYSPALKNGTLVLAGTGSSGTVVDTVQSGHFAYTLPVEEFTESNLSFYGEGCPNRYINIFLKPDVTVKVTGNDLFVPLWKVESPIPEQQTQNRLTEYCRDVFMEFINVEQSRDWNKIDSINMVLMKKEMDILPSLPVDAATIRALMHISEWAMITAKERKDFPYMEQLKELEKTVAARAPKGFEDMLAEIHTYVYAKEEQQIAEELASNESVFFKKYDDIAPENILQTILDKYKGKAVLIDIWATWCGPCRAGHKAMAPMKEEMKGQNIQFVYITPPSSPPTTWQEMIKDIDGHHYYLTEDQYHYILNKYEAPGIPTYAIYNTKGKQTYKSIGFPGLDTIKKEIEKALK